MSSQSQKNDASFFLRSLKDEGIDEVYVKVDSHRKAVTLTHPDTGPGVIEPKKKVKAAGSAPVSAKPPARTISNPAASESQSVNTSAEEAMSKLCEQASVCTLCPELASTRKKVVFGSGSIKARLMFIGEAPGRDEDEQGLPFVGAAGQLLTKIIESIQLTRDEVYIANTLKCRPPQNRPPQPDEISNCNPYLQKQIELIQPQIICALGTFAAQTVLKTQTPISKLRGQFWDFNGSTRVICTFHPAYLLRNPGEKRKVWEDMKMIKAELERLNP